MVQRPNFFFRPKIDPIFKYFFNPIDPIRPTHSILSLFSNSTQYLSVYQRPALELSPYDIISNGDVCNLVYSFQSACHSNCDSVRITLNKNYILRFCSWAVTLYWSMPFQLTFSLESIFYD